MTQEPKPRVSLLQLITWHLDTWQPDAIEAWTALAGVVWAGWTWFWHAFAHNPTRYRAMYDLATDLRVPPELSWCLWVGGVGLLQMVVVYYWNRSTLLRTAHVARWFRLRRLVVILQVFTWSFLFVMLCGGDPRYGSTGLYLLIAGAQIWVYYRTGQDQPD